MRSILTLKHLSGSKAQKQDHLSIPTEREIIFGRDPACHVRYDESEELVSRKHLKIVISNDAPVRYTVVDLGSRNGTFVNRQRVFGAVRLLHGARVQLGAGGPEFEFQSEAKAPSASRKSPLWTKVLRASVLTVAVLMTGVLAYFAWSRLGPAWHNWQSSKSSETQRTRALLSEALASVAAVRVQWRVCDKQTGTALAIAHIPNRRGTGSNTVPLIEGAPPTLPLFLLSTEQRVEPVLIPVTAGSGQVGVGGEWNAYGVFVSETGALLTAAPQGQPWSSDWHWSPEEAAGALLVPDTNAIQVVPLAAPQFPNWHALASAFLAEDLPVDAGTRFRGRRISRAELQLQFTTTVTDRGGTHNARLAAESAGILLAAAEHGKPARLNQSEAGLHSGQAVWLAGDDLSETKVSGSSDELQISGCTGGRAVFDTNGTLLALCTPVTLTQPHEPMAIPASRGLTLLEDGINGREWQP